MRAIVRVAKEGEISFLATCVSENQLRKTEKKWLSLVLFDLVEPLVVWTVFVHTDSCRRCFRFLLMLKEMFFINSAFFRRVTILKANIENIADYLTFQKWKKIYAQHNKDLS